MNGEPPFITRHNHLSTRIHCSWPRLGLITPSHHDSFARAREVKVFVPPHRTARRHRDQVVHPVHPCLAVVLRGQAVRRKLATGRRSRVAAVDNESLAGPRVLALSTLGRRGHIWEVEQRGERLAAVLGPQWPSVLPQQDHGLRILDVQASSEALRPLRVVDCRNAP